MNREWLDCLERGGNLAINVRYRVVLCKHRQTEKQIHILQIEILLCLGCTVKQIHILYIQEMQMQIQI